MLCACLPATTLPADAPADQVAARVRAAYAELVAAVPEVCRALEEAASFYPWPMVDVRAPAWSRGRVALCGDAAVAFLPTAGVGASNALRTAAALADELSRADAARVPLALDLWEQRCRRLVEHNQDDSRAAGRYCFVESRPLGWARDQLVRYYPVRRMIAQIVASMRQPF
jgi:2-polyprenyl-6-methoxyphenol hydroxylase-like FAD-dependent oxidoreductase